MKILTKNKTEYRVVFFKGFEKIDVERTERFEILINQDKLGILECRELDSFASNLSGSFYMDELRDEVISKVDYNMEQIKVSNGIGEEYD